MKVPINKIVGWENGYGEISVKQVKILSSIFDVTNDMILLGIENSRVDLTGITNEQQNEVMNIWEFLLKEGGNHGIFEKIEFLRSRTGLSRKAFAKKVFVSESSIFNWEVKHIKADVENIIKLSSILKISIDCLMNDEKDIELLTNELCEEEIDLLNEMVEKFKKINDAKKITK